MFEQPETAAVFYFVLQSEKRDGQERFKLWPKTMAMGGRRPFVLRELGADSRRLPGYDYENHPG